VVSRRHEETSRRLVEEKKKRPGTGTISTLGYRKQNDKNADWYEQKRGSEVEKKKTMNGCGEQRQ